MIHAVSVNKTIISKLSDFITVNWWLINVIKKFKCLIAGVTFSSALLCTIKDTIEKQKRCCTVHITKANENGLHFPWQLPAMTDNWPGFYHEQDEIQFHLISPALFYFCVRVYITSFSLSLPLSALLPSFIANEANGHSPWLP